MLSVLICAAVSPTANAIDVQISIGDRDYYQGAPEFWDWGWHWVWVPGHWYRKRWIHGYYERRGDWNRRYFKHRHRWHERDRGRDHRH